MLAQFYHDPILLCVGGTIKTPNRIQPQAPDVGDIRQEMLRVFLRTV